MPPARGRGRKTRGKQPARGSPRGRQSLHSAPAAAPTLEAEDAEVEEAAAKVEDDAPAADATEVENKDVVKGDVEEKPSESKPEEEETSGTVAATAEAETETAAVQADKEGEGTVEAVTAGDVADQSEDQRVKPASCSEVAAGEPDQKAAEEEMQDAVGGSAPGTERKEGSDEEVIVIDDDSNDGAGREKAAAKSKPPKSAFSDSESYWRVRVCPVIFEDFCKLKDVFQTVMKMSLSFEFRMSQLLLSPLAKGWNHGPSKDYIPWVPSNEKAFMKPQTAATLGMLEMKVIDSSLVDLIRCIRTAKLSRKGRLRFEIKRISKEEAQFSELKKDLEEQGTPVEPNSKTEKRTDKADATKPSPPAELLVNFALRLSSVQEPAFKHEPDHKSTPEDSYIFVKKIPDEVPDNVLEAVILLKMVERTKGEDNSCKATFDVESQGSAQQYMERFDGILINFKDLELSTTLGTLQDAREKHAQQQLEHAEAVGAGEKRKAESSLRGGSAAKRSRGAYSAAQRGWRGRGVSQRGTRGATRMSRWTPTRGPPRGRGRPGLRRGMPHLSPHIPDLRDLPMGSRGPQPDNSMRVMQDIHAQVLATHRDLTFLQQQARIAQMKLVEEQGRADSYQQAYADTQRREYNQRRGGDYQRDAYGDRYGRENRGGNTNRGRGMNRGRRPYFNRSPGQYREGDRRRR